MRLQITSGNKPLSPIPPSEKVVDLLNIFNKFPKVEHSVVDAFGIGHKVCSGEGGRGG